MQEQLVVPRIHIMSLLLAIRGVHTCLMAQDGAKNLGVEIIKVPRKLLIAQFRAAGIVNSILNQPLVGLDLENDGPKELIVLKESDAAVYLNLTKDQLKKLRVSGKILPIKFNRKISYLVVDLDQLKMYNPQIFKEK